MKATEYRVAEYHGYPYRIATRTDRGRLIHLPAWSARQARRDLALCARDGRSAQIEEWIEPTGSRPGRWIQVVLVYEEEES